jgi:hypothetical protein
MTGETGSPWMEIPGIDDIYSLDEAYEIVEGGEISADAEYAVDVCFPHRSWSLIPFYKPKSTVWLWVGSQQRWRKIASFLSPRAAYEYGHFVVHKLKRMADAAEREG